MITCRNISTKKKTLSFKDLTVGMFFVTWDNTGELMLKISECSSVIITAERVVEIPGKTSVYRISSMNVEYHVDYENV